MDFLAIIIKGRNLAWLLQLVLEDRDRGRIKKIRKFIPFNILLV